MNRVSDSFSPDFMKPFVTLQGSTLRGIVRNRGTGQLRIFLASYRNLGYVFV